MLDYVVNPYEATGVIHLVKTEAYKDIRNYEYEGTKFFTLAIRKASRCRAHSEYLRRQDKDGFISVCLARGWGGAMNILQYDSRCRELWQKGDSQKAARLITVWASTCAMILRQNEADQAKVLHEISKNLMATPPIVVI